MQSIAVFAVGVASDEPDQTTLPLIVLGHKRDRIQLLRTSPVLSPPDDIEQFGSGDVIRVDARGVRRRWTLEEVDAEARIVLVPRTVPLVDLFDLHESTLWDAPTGTWEPLSQGHHQCGHEHHYEQKTQ